MATWPSTRPLHDWQTEAPILHLQDDAPGLTRTISDEEMREVFPRPGRFLKTWGRDVGPRGALDPHWIGVQQGTPLHTDMAYPRYAHHLMVRADPGLYLHGVDPTPMDLLRGTFLIFDAHSPHKLSRHKGAKGGGPWYLAVSVDGPGEPLAADDVLPILVAYANHAPFAP